MFAKVIASLLLVTGLVASVTSTPLRISRVSAHVSPSFNNWQGFSSLNGFDNFYGSGNFDGLHNNGQTIIERNVRVCHTQKIEIVQQRLVLLHEMIKRVITEQICDVETQVIIFQQFHGNSRGFSDDLRRNSGRVAGYDQAVLGNFGQLVNSDGSLSTNDLGFNGQSVGNQTVLVGGTNWNDQNSPTSVSNAFNAASAALTPES